MDSSQRQTPQIVCENLLREELRYNNEHHTFPSESIVAERLLVRGVELQDAYEELHSKLHAKQSALQCFLSLVLSTAAFWSPQKMQMARTARDELEKVNLGIAQKATELAALLNRRSDLHNSSGFSGDTHFHVCEVIKGASRGTPLFGHYVEGKLDELRQQFDSKYWPSLADFVQDCC